MAHFSLSSSLIFCLDLTVHGHHLTGVAELVLVGKALITASYLVVEIVGKVEVLGDRLNVLALGTSLFVHLVHEGAEFLAVEAAIAIGIRLIEHLLECLKTLSGIVRITLELFDLSETGLPDLFSGLRFPVLVRFSGNLAQSLLLLCGHFSNGKVSHFSNLLIVYK